MFALDSALAYSGMAFACAMGFSVGLALDEYMKRLRHAKAVRSMSAERSSVSGMARELFAPGSEKSLEGAILGYAVEQSRKFDLGHGHRIMPRGMKESPRMRTAAAQAGLDGLISPVGFWETRIRLCVFSAVSAFILSSVFSWELALMAGLVGAVGGWHGLVWAIGSQRRRRAREIQRHLPEALDVIALGMRSGLSFDRSLTLYTRHFDTLLSKSLALAYKQWSCGLASRDDALRQAAASYDCALFARVVENIIRCLRFGTALVESLEEAAREARSAYRADKQEQVAKAPVKMMLPTGALILPAMLILVLGPVLLELAGGF